MGLIAPTGRQIVLPGMNILRFADGKAQEEWILQDLFGLLQPLEVIPPADAGPLALARFMAVSAARSIRQAGRRSRGRPAPPR